MIDSVNFEKSPNPETEKELSRFKGCLVGVAVADALGAPVEFLSSKKIKQKFGEVDEMLGGGVFNWDKGQFTDDTDQTLAIVDSLIDNRGYRPGDIAQRFLQWYKSGPKDIGLTTSHSLARLERGISWRESGSFAYPSNGSLMRTAPIGLFFRNNLIELDQAAAEVSGITHGHPDCILACQIAANLVAFLVNGDSKEAALEKVKEKFDKNSYSSTKLKEILKNDFVLSDEGNVFLTLSIALNSFLAASNFEDAVKKAIHAGGDTDTQAAVAGAFAGICWGSEKIPLRWKSKLNPLSFQEIEKKAEALYHLG